MKDFRQQEVWEPSHQFALTVYGATEAFPKEKLFGITGQLRRAAASIPADLAEGCGRDSDAERKRLIDVAHGSASEAGYFPLLALDLGHLSASAHDSLADEISQIKRMLGAFSRKLKAAR